MFDSDNRPARQKLMLGAILTGALMALSAEASVDNKVCYWNAEGLPYSKVPLPDADEALFSGGPIQALGAMHMEAPQLMIKSACGLIEDADLVRPREVYQSWGCSTDSSMAQMIEGLASGGVFVSELMSFLEYAFGKYAEEFAEHCAPQRSRSDLLQGIGEFPKGRGEVPSVRRELAKNQGGRGIFPRNSRARKGGRN